MRKNSYLKVLVFTGLLIAFEVVLTRFVQIPAEWFFPTRDRISLGFLPVSLSGALFGPVVGGVTAAVADIIRANLFPQGAFNPVFTVSAALRGVLYGLFLYGKKPSVVRVVSVCFIIFLFINAGLNSLWMTLFYETKFEVFFISKLAINAARFAVEALVMALTLPSLVKNIRGEIL